MQANGAIAGEGASSGSTAGAQGIDKRLAGAAMSKVIAAAIGDIAVVDSRAPATIGHCIMSPENPTRKPSPTAGANRPKKQFVSEK
jgi:hypothetical protein